MRRDPARVVLALLLIVSAGLFITGSILEHGHKEARNTHNESKGSGSEEPVAEGATEGSPVESVGSSERLFGLDLERPLIVATACVVTLALAAIAFGWMDRRALWLIVLFAAVFAVLDVREATHQSNEGRSSLVAIAAILAAIHVSVALLAGVRARAGDLPRG